IQKACPRTRTILLTMHGEDTYVLQALQMGIRGYVLKSQAVTDLVRAVREVSRGAVYLSPSVSGAGVEAYRTKKDRRDPLTLPRGDEERHDDRAQRDDDRCPGDGADR